MTYFKDLSIYSYSGKKQSSMQNNVGWLGPGHAYLTWEPLESVLDLLWKYCKVHVNQARGFHGCHLCPGSYPIRAARNHEERPLGSAEIRAFSNRGAIFAAPNLIYHYMSVHGYRPPDEFIEELSEGPCPPDPEYFAKLEKLGHSWRDIEAR
jgi:hypothetical protein